jgi:hypothetical protein
MLVKVKRSLVEMPDPATQVATITCDSQAWDNFETQMKQELDAESDSVGSGSEYAETLIEGVVASPHRSIDGSPLGSQDIGDSSIGNETLAKLRDLGSKICGIPTPQQGRPVLCAVAKQAFSDSVPATIPGTLTDAEPETVLDSLESLLAGIPTDGEDVWKVPLQRG